MLRRLQYPKGGQIDRRIVLLQKAVTKQLDQRPLGNRLRLYDQLVLRRVECRVECQLCNREAPPDLADVAFKFKDLAVEHPRRIIRQRLGDSRT